MRPRLWGLLVAGVAVGGLILRIALLNGPAGTYDSDEAVVGLMGQEMLDGEWRAFYWGQHYGGTLETGLVALAGADPSTMKLVPVALWAVAGLLTWRVGRRFLDDRVARLAGLLTWIAPGAYVWWSTKERGFYCASVVLGLALVLAAQRLDERGGRPLDWALVGLSAGLGFWTSPTVAYFALPAGLWILVRRVPLRWSWVAVPSAVVGALPWLWHNVEQGWPSLDRPPQPEEVGYVTGIGRLLWQVLPIALNLRSPFSATWVGVPALAVAAYLAFGVALLVRRPPLLLALALVVFPFVYAAFPGAWFVGEARYAFFATPFLALAMAWVVRRPLPMVAVVAVASVLTLAAVDHIGPEWPEDVDADLAALRQAGVDHVWADYWFAYRLAFLSEGDLVASPMQSKRELSVHDAVAADPTPAFLYSRGDERWRALEDALDDSLDVPFRRLDTEHFVVLLVRGRVDPASLPAGTVP